MEEKRHFSHIFTKAYNSHSWKLRPRKKANILMGEKFFYLQVCLHYKKFGMRSGKPWCTWNFDAGFKTTDFF